jgi:glyoxylase-like metal-dependent hydrolase (beta-lactamase superfamily II)
VVLDQNVLVINTGDKLALFEKGMSSVKRNEDMGRLVANLKQSGIDPNDIDAVIPTHAHIDHIGGIMAADGSRNFPNAQIYISQADLEFWTDDKRLVPRPKALRSPRARTSSRTGTASCSTRMARRSFPACKQCIPRGTRSDIPASW